MAVPKDAPAISDPTTPVSQSVAFGLLALGSKPRSQPKVGDTGAGAGDVKWQIGSNCTCTSRFRALGDEGTRPARGSGEASDWG
jgi:hypothetical protein